MVQLKEIFLILSFFGHLIIAIKIAIDCKLCTMYIVLQIYFSDNINLHYVPIKESTLNVQIN